MLNQYFYCVGFGVRETINWGGTAAKEEGLFYFDVETVVKHDFRDGLCFTN